MIKVSSKLWSVLTLVILTLSLSTTPISSDTSYDKSFEHNEMPNVIFLIGDGMGFEQLKAASMVEYGAFNQTIMDKHFPYLSFYETDTSRGELTDSAAGGTALATGEKTGYGYVSIDESKTYKLKTMLELLQYDFGYTTGLVTTTEMAHATPATFSTHIDDRNDFQSIIDEMVSKDIDVLMGGGLNTRYIGPQTITREVGAKHGYEVATTVNHLYDKQDTANKLLGIFGHESDAMPYEIDRDPTVDPSILETTTGAIKILDRKSSPFFLMVEGGRIDHAGHMIQSTEEQKITKTQYNVVETIMFLQAVEAAYNYAKEDGNTIVVVGADHETGGLTVYDGNSLNSTLPNSFTERDQKLNLRKQRAAALNVTWKWTAHTRTPVPLYVYGADFSDDIDQNHEVFWGINKAVGGFPVVYHADYTIKNDSVTALARIEDKDSTITGVDLVVNYSNGTKKEYRVADGGNSLLNVNATVPYNDSIDASIYFSALDGKMSTNSFDNNGELINQSVFYEKPPITPTTNTSSTTTTSKSSTTSEDALFIFPYLSIGSIFFILISLRRKRN